MSFILDALKKSENDRQRQTGPALFEVRVAPPRSKFPILAVSIVSLLVVNLGVVGWLMLRKPAVAAVPPPATAPQVTAAVPGPQPQQTVAPAVIPPPAPTQAGPGYEQQQVPAGPPGGSQQQLPPQSYPQQAYNTAPPANSYGQQNPQGPGAYPAQGFREPMLADEIGGNRALNPDDYAPARDAPAPGTGAGRVVQSTNSGLPTYEEASTRTSIPPVHMDLHSYAPDPAKRFVLINMKRLYEGQSLPEGVKVESITNEGAILSYSGTRFVLDSD
jgi:general secretion pathway protein B